MLGSTQHAIHQKFRDDIHFQKKEIEESLKPKQLVRQISQVVTNKNLQFREDKVNWSDMTKLHDQMRAIASERNKHKEKSMKMLHKAFLEKQMEENKLKKVKESQFKDKDEWNTIEQQGYNDEVLKRSDQLQNSARIGKHDTSIVSAPDWNDESIKYIKRSLNPNISNANKSVDGNNSKVVKKHFLYPLLNKSKRSHFRMMMEKQ